MKRIFLSLSLCRLVVIYTNVTVKLKLQAQREFAYSQMVIKPSFLTRGEERGDRNKEADTEGKLSKRYNK